MSDLGRVRSLPRKGTYARILSAYPAKRGGYLAVSLTRGQVTRPHTVHKLVALAFIGPRPDGMEVRHRDGDALNPRLSNLAYGTSTQNAQDTIAHGNHPNGRKTHCKRNHPFDAANTYIIPSTGSRQCRTCQRDWLREYKRAKRKAAR